MYLQDSSLGAVGSTLFNDFHEGIEQIRHQFVEDEVSIDTLAQGSAVWVTLSKIRLQFERALSDRMSMRSKKEKARLLTEVLDGFKAEEDLYTPRQVWMRKPIDEQDPAMVEWAANKMAVSGKTTEERAQMLFAKLKAFREGFGADYEQDIAEGFRLICDYDPKHSPGGESELDDPEIAQHLIQKLIAATFTEAHASVLAAYANLKGHEKAADWLLGKEARLIAKWRGSGQLDRELTVQESYDLYWGAGELGEQNMADDGLVNGVVKPKEIPQNTKSYTAKQVALICFYQGKRINRNNAQGLADMYGINNSPNSAEILARKWDKWCVEKKINAAYPVRVANALIRDIAAILVELQPNERVVAERHMKGITSKRTSEN
jgi:hypothetical protein